jgi:hypothetical protein
MHVDYTKDHKIVRIDILRASKRLRCHFREALCGIDGLLPAAMSRQYDAATDVLTMAFLVESDPCTMVKTDDEVRHPSVLLV